MKVAVTIDVEEEGLFANRYEPGDAPVNNVGSLRLLDPVFRDWGIRPTLLVSYQVARSAHCRELLLELRDRWQGEIGAHLHPWNTPPLENLPYPEPVPSELIPRELLSSKLNTLLDSISSMGVSPVSFRMGRFNMGPRMFSVLESTGIRVDSSVAPMRKEYGGPNHLSAPTDPYFPDPDSPCSRGTSHILEVPMTIHPVIRGLGAVLERLGKSGFAPDTWIPWVAITLGSIAVQPAWTSLNRLKAGTLLHRGRGGRVLSVFFHSSELFPGGNPKHPTTEHVTRFLKKLNDFFAWLSRHGSAESVTLSDLREDYDTSVHSDK